MTDGVATDPSVRTHPTVPDWIGVGVLALCGALAALLECVLVPLYVGSTVLPIAVVLAIVTNVLFPRLARRLVPRGVAVVAPFVTWLIVVLAFGVVARPEGDVILPGGSGAEHYVSYGVMLLGALAGVVTVVSSAPGRR